MSRANALTYPVAYQPQLVEDAVFWALRHRPEAKRFRREREKLYSLVDEDERNAAFERFHQDWFARLGLDRPLAQALQTWPVVKSRTQRCLVLHARHEKEMGADLYGEPSDGTAEKSTRQLVVHVTPSLLAQPEPFTTFLARELLHVGDMLDPAFGYEPDLPPSDLGPAYDHFLRQRYRVVWDLNVDGRLTRSGRLPANVRHEHWRVFQRHFSGTEAELKRAFTYFFESDRVTHNEIVAFCRAPYKWLGTPDSARARIGACSLCGLPSYSLTPSDQALSRASLQYARAEHPGWVGGPVCPQCADLYEAKLLL